MPLITPRGAILQIYANNLWNKVSEHNRQPLSVEVLRIEKSVRMSNGTLRKFFIADKKRFSISWDMLPSYSTLTVDGGWGAQDLKTFYDSVAGTGSFDIRINLAQNGASQESSGFEAYTVTFTDCSFAVVKRGIQPHWNVSISMEEV